MFGALMWKDLRLQRSVIVAALLIAVMIYGIVWPVLTFSAGGADPITAKTWAFYLYSAAQLALGASVLLAAVCAGAPAPTERRERWAEELAMLPISRLCVVSVRLLSAIAVFASIICVHLAIAHTSQCWVRSLHIPKLSDGGPHTWADHDWQANQAVVWQSPSISPLIGGNLAAGAFLFGMAWLVGSFTRSATAAAATPILLLLAILVPLVQIRGFLDVLTTSLLAAGICALVAGTVLALRRIEP